MNLARIHDKQKLKTFWEEKIERHDQMTGNEEARMKSSALSKYVRLPHPTPAQPKWLSVGRIGSLSKRILCFCHRDFFFFFFQGLLLSGRGDYQENPCLLNPNWRLLWKTTRGGGAICAVKEYIVKTATEEGKGWLDLAFFDQKQIFGSLLIPIYMQLKPAPVGQYYEETFVRFH